MHGACSKLTLKDVQQQPWHQQMHGLSLYAGMSEAEGNCTALAYTSKHLANGL